jgi:DNA-binding PadR family transcriptional regulator
MARSTTKPLTGTVFYVLLALADRERYGLDIVREIDRRTGGDVRLGPGTLYNAIKKMTHDGLIDETDGPEDPADGDPRRRYYRITARGRVMLEGEAARLERLVDAARVKHVIASKRPS